MDENRVALDINQTCSVLGLAPITSSKSTKVVTQRASACWQRTSAGQIYDPLCVIPTLVSGVGVGTQMFASTNLESAKTFCVPVNLSVVVQPKFGQRHLTSRERDTLMVPNLGQAIKRQGPMFQPVALHSAAFSVPTIPPECFSNQKNLLQFHRQ